MRLVFFRMWWKRRQRWDVADYVYLFSALIFVVGLLLGIWFLYDFFRRPSGRLSESIKDTSYEKIVEQCLMRRKLDGVCVQSEAEQDPRTVGVMVENSYEAWPLSGITEASVVYEAPVESSIPRFLLLFPDTATVDRVGPVRSSRPYFLDWLSEYGDPVYLHVGGSDEALGRIEEEHIFSINEMARGWYFWRDEDRQAPHNTYTSSKLWTSALERYVEQFPATSIEPWEFVDMSACEESCVTTTTVSFSPLPLYTVFWKYDANTNRWARHQGKEGYADEPPLFADTIIVLRVHASVLDEIGRKHIDTIGTGDVVIFQAGRVVQGIWSKDSVKGRTLFSDADGNPLSIHPGKIWIEVVPQGGSVTWE